MAKQLVTQLDDLTAEQVVGGGTFYTAQVDAVYETQIVDSVETQVLVGFTWGGLWNPPSTTGAQKGKNNSGKQKISNGASNNLYSDTGIDVSGDDGQQIYYWYNGVQYTLTAGGGTTPV